MLLRTLPTAHDRQQRRAAFTLMEMLVVVAIIVALAGIGGYFLMGAMSSAEKDIARIQVRGPLTDAVKTYYLRHKQWPQSLQILLQVDQKTGQPYLEEQSAIIDPWGKEYQYNPAGTNNGGRRPDIWTNDPTTGEEIGNWTPLTK